MRPLLRAHPRHTAALAVFFAGAALLILGGVSLVGLAGAVLAGVGSLAAGATAPGAGA